MNWIKISPVAKMFFFFFLSSLLHDPKTLKKNDKVKIVNKCLRNSFYIKSMVRTGMFLDIGLQFLEWVALNWDLLRFNREECPGLSGVQIKFSGQE